MLLITGSLAMHKILIITSKKYKLSVISPGVLQQLGSTLGLLT